jgi:hypothetical protein
MRQTNRGQTNLLIDLQIVIVYVLDRLKVSRGDNVRKAGLWLPRFSMEQVFGWRGTFCMPVNDLGNG